MKILKLLKADEKKAPVEYRKLLKQVNTKHDKNLIKGIINDEKRHLKILNKIGGKN